MPIEVILALIQALVQFAPQIPSIVASVEMAVKLINENRAPTAEEQAVIDAGLEAAHAELQRLASGPAPASTPPSADAPADAAHVIPSAPASGVQSSTPASGATQPTTAQSA